MAVRFVGEQLIDDEGLEVKIPYQTLLNACLEGEYRTPSVKNIIFAGVQRVTGQRIVQYRYRQSSLFQKLEGSIIADEKYQKLKEDLNQKRKEKNNETAKYIIENPDKEKWKSIRLKNKIRKRVYKCH